MVLNLPYSISIFLGLAMSELKIYLVVQASEIQLKRNWNEEFYSADVFMGSPPIKREFVIDPFFNKLLLKCQSDSSLTQGHLKIALTSKAVLTITQWVQPILFPIVQQIANAFKICALFQLFIQNKSELQAWKSNERCLLFSRWIRTQLWS